jgi:hypothetical protein
MNYRPTASHGWYPDGLGWAELCDPPEFRRFLDLRVGSLVAKDVVLIQRTAFVSCFPGEFESHHPHVPNCYLHRFDFKSECELANIHSTR